MRLFCSKETREKMKIILLFHFRYERMNARHERYGEHETNTVVEEGDNHSHNTARSGVGERSPLLLVGIRALSKMEQKNNFHFLTCFQLDSTR